MFRRDGEIKCFAFIEGSAITCPEPISETITEILRIGILQARAAAWSGDAELCAALTDHIHNLPGLLTDFSDNCLMHYWETERPVFIRCVPPEVSNSYSACWEELRKHCRLRDPVATES